MDNIDQVARQMIQQHMDQCDERMQEIRGYMSDMKDSVRRIHDKGDRSRRDILVLLVTILLSIGAAFFGLR